MPRELVQIQRLSYCDHSPDSNAILTPMPLKVCHADPGPRHRPALSDTQDLMQKPLYSRTLFLKIKQLLGWFLITMGNPSRWLIHCRKYLFDWPVSNQLGHLLNSDEIQAVCPIKLVWLSTFCFWVKLNKKKRKITGVVLYDWNLCLDDNNVVKLKKKKRWR